MKAMTIVAHPDDCVIFAYSFMHAYQDLDWTVCYVTYQANDHRGNELKAFWDKRNIKTKFLGYEDDWHDIENKKISFNEQDAWTDIQFAIADQDIVLTHDENGDYGHLHHVFVNRATANHPRRVTFAGVGQGNAKFTIPSGTYELAELPQHGSVIAGFHRDQHVNEYLIPDSVKKLLNRS